MRIVQHIAMLARSTCVLSTCLICGFGCATEQPDPSGDIIEDSVSTMDTHSDDLADETSSDAGDTSVADASSDTADASEDGTRDVSNWTCPGASESDHDSNYDDECAGNVGCTSKSSSPDGTGASCVCTLCDNERCIRLICD